MAKAQERSAVFDGLSRGVPGVGPRAMAPPAASFEDPARIIASPSLRHDPKKMFLGVIGAEIKKDGNGQRYAQGGHEIGVSDDRHQILVAGSRSGKSRSAILPVLHGYAGSAICVDPKGELALATAKRRRALGQRVCVLDPFGTTGGKLEGCKCGFNPLALMRPASLIEDATLIADALVLKSGHDPHWDESALTFIEGVILEVATAERFDGRRNLVTVRDLIAMGETLDEEKERNFSPATITGDDLEALPDDELRELVTRGQAILDERDGGESGGLAVLESYMRESAVPAVQRAAADLFDRPERERASVLAVARRHLRALAFPEIENSLGGEGKLDLADLKTSAMTVYLCLPGRHMGTCGRWLRLFVNLALQAMERTPGKPAAGCPVLFVLDEFAALGHMKQIEDAAGQIAGYGVKLWPILQDLGQLKSLYKDRWETFMGNAGVLQFFGNNDLTTLEWISKRLGTTTLEQQSGSVVTPGAAARGAGEESWSPRTTAVLEPFEIAMRFGRADPLLRQLIIRPEYAPMILQRAFYDKHSAFAR